MAVTGTDHELKLFVDKQKGRVLFAEADGGFVARLFSFLTLPLGTVVTVIGKTPSEPASTLGCFRSLYQSAASLGNEYFYAVQFKDMLLQPGQGWMVFLTKALKFMVADNLQVTPVVPGTILGYLNNLGTIDPSTIEERIVKLGVTEWTEFVKCTLLSTTPLTDLFVSKTKSHVNSVPKNVSLQNKDTGGGRKINVKVVLKKSSKEFLFVEAGSDFIDFLFSLLLIPLGDVLHILEGQSGLGCIDGFYKSAQSLNSKHFGSEDHKNNLLRPELPPHFIWENHLLPLGSTPMGQIIGGVARTGGFVRKEAVFIVLDDLTVKPSSAAEAISIMNTHKISFSDLEERTLSLGAAEGISIMRASLNSTSAISIGLLGNNIVFKEPKQEKHVVGASTYIGHAKTHSPLHPLRSSPAKITRGRKKRRRDGSNHTAEEDTEKHTRIE